LDKHLPFVSTSHFYSLEWRDFLEMEGIEREVEKGEGRRVAIGMDDEFVLFFDLFCLNLLN
jgi:hypothetical protein